MEGARADLEPSPFAALGAGPDVYAVGHREIALVLATLSVVQIEVPRRVAPDRDVEHDDALRPAAEFHGRAEVVLHEDLELAHAVAVAVAVAAAGRVHAHPLGDADPRPVQRVADA